MRFLLTILFFALTLAGYSQNTIKAIYIRDIARDWVQFTTTASAGTMPAASAFTVNGVNPTAVIKTNDTLVSLKCASTWTQGATVTVNYTAPGGGELGGMSTFSGRGVDNQITAGDVISWTTAGHTNIFQGVGVNFNATYSIDSGDIVELAPGDYLTFDVSLMTGVRFVSQYSATADSVRFTYFNMREETIHSGLFGHPAMPSKSIKIRSTYAGNFGIGCFATGYIWFENLEIYNVSQGIQVKTVSDLLFPPYNLSRLSYQSLTTKYISIHNLSEEAFYIGSDVAAPLIPITWAGFGLTVDSAGRDALQFRNGSVWLKNCSVTRIGLDSNLSHAHAVTFGTTTTYGWFENITGSDIVGNGFLINGYGVVTIKNCQLESIENTVYIKNYDDQDNFNKKGLIVNFICEDSEFECTNVLGYSLDARRDPAKTSLILNINTGTNFVGNIYVEDGVHGGIDNGIIYNTNSVCRKTGYIY